jgi:hypothetical protein
LKVLIGAAVGLLLFSVDHRRMAIAAWAITAIFSVMPYVWSRGSVALDRFFASLGCVLGRGISVLLLSPIFLIVFTIIRAFNRLARTDPLHLRDDEHHTFWLECDSNVRKRKHVTSMFASERMVGRPSRKLAFAVLCLFLVTLAEVLLRLLGVGNPILYVDDPIVGYYPAPHQSVSRYGGNTVATNEFGMRAPDYSRNKPPGHFRIFMVGDSTLWGGSYVDQGQIYARLVERHLNERLFTSTVEVLNMGVNGWGPYHELGYVEQFGAFDADVAIICLPIGDLKRPLSRLSNLPYFPAHSPPRLALEEIFLQVIWRYQSRLIGRPPEQVEAVQVERGMSTYLELARRLREAGCEVFFEILPSRTAGTSTRIPEREEAMVERFQDALARDGFTANYPVAFAANRPAAEMKDLYHDDCHLHWLGHQLYAEYLTERILNRSRTLSRWSAEHPKTVVKGRAER